MADSATGDILRSTLVSIIRHFLSILAAYLISKGLVQPEILSEGNLAVLATGIVAALVSLGWVVYNKLKTRNLVQAAAEAPANASMATIKADAEAKPLLGDK